MSTALVTGATAGIGEAFARRFAKDGSALVLVARDVERLKRLADDLHLAYGVEVEVLPADLADTEGCRLVEQRLADPGEPVDVLVNNAGFAVGRSFAYGDIEAEEAMLRVLVRAVLRLSRAALPGMLDRRSGVVINVSSVASFVPQGTYSAAKAWVTSFSVGLAGDLRGKGVRVQALCPGYTHTEFHDRAGMDMSRTPEWMWLDVDQVVEASLRAVAKDQVVCVPGRRYKTLVGLARLVPLPVLGQLARRVRGTRRPS